MGGLEVTKVLPTPQVHSFAPSSFTPCSLSPTRVCTHTPPNLQMSSCLKVASLPFDH
jgi:hypothetical protein